VTISLDFCPDNNVKYKSSESFFLSLPIHCCFAAELWAVVRIRKEASGQRECKIQCGEAALLKVLHLPDPADGGGGDPRRLEQGMIFENSENSVEGCSWRWPCLGAGPRSDYAFGITGKGWKNAVRREGIPDAHGRLKEIIPSPTKALEHYLPY